MAAPSVFVSYSHDSSEHKDWVIKLATALRSNGVDATLDVWDLTPGQDASLFMQRGISASDRVLLVCSESYVQKAERGTGGVGFERLIVTHEVVESIDTKKFIPLIRNNKTTNGLVPKFLGPRLYIDFRDDGSYEGKLEELLRELHGVPAIPKPELGASPFSGQPQKSGQVERLTGPTGVTVAGQRVLDENWFEKESGVSRDGLIKTGYQASMELRFGLHDGINKSQIELLDSARKSQINTFGWPIAVILDNREEYRPRPYGDGIRAEIAISSTDGGRESYDYWAVRSNGDFYLRQSLFEDERDEEAIFFNTRIVRVSEALLYASNLYTNLGVPPAALLSVRVSHAGIANRVLKSSSFNRMLRGGRKIAAAESQAEIAVSVEELKSNLAASVEKILSPLFMLFDFQIFSSDVYADIANRFSKGEVT